MSAPSAAATVATWPRTAVGWLVCHLCVYIAVAVLSAVLFFATASLYGLLWSRESGQAPPDPPQDVSSPERLWQAPSDPPTDVLSPKPLWRPPLFLERNSVVATVQSGDQVNVQTETASKESTPQLESHSSPKGNSVIATADWQRDLEASNASNAPQRYSPVTDKDGRPVGSIVGFAYENGRPLFVVLAVSDNGPLETIGIPLTALSFAGKERNSPIEMKLDKEALKDAPRFRYEKEGWTRVGGAPNRPHNTPSMAPAPPPSRFQPAK